MACTAMVAQRLPALPARCTCLHGRAALAGRGALPAAGAAPRTSGSPGRRCPDQALPSWAPGRPERELPRRSPLPLSPRPGWASWLTPAAAAPRRGCGSSPRTGAPAGEARPRRPAGSAPSAPSPAAEGDSAGAGLSGPSSPAPRPRPLTFSSPCQLSSRRPCRLLRRLSGRGALSTCPRDAGLRGRRRAGSGVRFCRVAPEAGVQSQDTAEDCTARPGEAVVAAAAAGQERRGDGAVQLGAARRKFSL